MTTIFTFLSVRVFFVKWNETKNVSRTERNPDLLLDTILFRYRFIKLLEVTNKSTFLSVRVKFFEKEFCIENQVPKQKQIT